MKRLWPLPIMVLVAACDATYTVVAPKVIYCPALDSALVRAKRDSFISPLICPLTAPDTVKKP